MEPEFITYQKFNDVALADMLVLLLEENDIPFVMEEEGPVFNPSFSFREDTSSYAVKVRSEDFELVNQLLLQAETDTETVVADDYYLFDFTDEELLEILRHTDEWSAFDISLARKILADRGKAVSDAEIDNMNNKRLDELKKPEATQQVWITIGYISAFLGGLLGLFIGWHLFNHKKILPNGEKVYGYTAHDRRHGKIIFYIALVSFIIWITLAIMQSSNSRVMMLQPV